MKNSFFIAFILLLVLAIGTGFNRGDLVQKDFSGSWELDSANSEFNGLPAIVAVQKLIVKQSDQKIIINSLNKGLNNTYNNTLDDSPAKQILTDSCQVISNTQLQQNNTLKRVLNVSFPNEPDKALFKREEVWVLSPDGKTLSIDEVVTTIENGQTYSFKAVYAKK
jgi:hypothetical protein